MKLEMFCVKDRATDAFGNPMFLLSRGQAIRSFSDQVNKVEDGNQLNTHPEDYDLYYLGVFDTNSGEFEVSRPVLVVLGRDVLVKK